MKNVFSFVLPLLLAAATVSASPEWRTFENTDKTKSFRGRLVGYDPKKEIVTVQRKTTMRPVRFKVALLSEDNQKFVKARAKELEAASGLRMMFYEHVEKLSTKRSGDTRTSQYNGGFKIEIRNHARQSIEDVEIEWIAVYRKDAVNGLGSVATKRGSESISTLIPNLDENIKVDGIPLKSYRKAGSVKGVGGST